MRAADWIIKQLETYTDHVFCLVGGGSMHLNDALYGSKLTPVFMLHEQGAAFAAQTYGHITGLGVCMVTTGPGGTNAITGCAAAWMDSTPVLFISGQVQRKHMSQGKRRYVGPQEVEIVELVKPITKYAITITEPEWVKPCFEMAVAQAMTGRKGPAWLDIPQDIQGADIE
jgi:acetolactate synthase I/II/III large subunit